MEWGSERCDFLHPLNDPKIILENMYDLLLLVKGNMTRYHSKRLTAVVAFEALKFCVLPLAIQFASYG